MAVNDTDQAFQRMAHVKGVETHAARGDGTGVRSSERLAKNWWDLARRDSAHTTTKIGLRCGVEAGKLRFAGPLTALGTKGALLSNIKGVFLYERARPLQRHEGVKAGESVRTVYDVKQAVPRAWDKELPPGHERGARMGLNALLAQSFGNRSNGMDVGMHAM